MGYTATTVNLGNFTLLETFDTVVSEDGYNVSFSFRGVSGSVLVLFIVASPESGYGGYANLEVVRTVVNHMAMLISKFNFQSYRYTIKYLGDQIIQVTREAL